MKSEFSNGHKLLVGDEDMIDMLTLSENLHISEISLMETTPLDQMKWTSAVVHDLENIVKQLRDIIQTDLTEIKSQFAGADEMFESLLQSQIDNDMVPRSELVLAQKEMEGCQELIRTFQQLQIRNEIIAQVSDTGEICEVDKGG